MSSFFCTGSVLVFLEKGKNKVSDLEIQYQNTHCGMTRNTFITYFSYIGSIYINRTTFYLAYSTFFSKIELKIQLQVSSVINTQVINIKDL